MRRTIPTLVALLVVVVVPHAIRAQNTSPTDRLNALVPEIEKNLRENVIPFWFPRSIDREDGGYTIHYGPKGEPLPGGTKAIVTQARQLWLASRLLRSEYAVPGLREAADHGFAFLRDRMWDREHGGFFWEVDDSGRKVLRPHKHLYGQAFGLYALSEYSLASGNGEALALAQELFGLLERKAHDAQYGGYREWFGQNWSDPPAGERPYLGSEPGQKLMNTHLHLMEAVTTFLRASSLPLARERLTELVAIESHAVVRDGWVACTDRHERDWTPVGGPQFTRVSYGHDLENIWLIADALAALHQPSAPYHDLFRDLFAYSRTHGYDEVQGGFYDSGPRGQAADRRAKVWWVQAEALVSALAMFEATRDARYVDVFEATWRFVNTKQTDWGHGEWFDTIEPDGRTRGGNKAHPWKAGYHNGRALLESLERIKRMTRTTRRG